VGSNPSRHVIDYKQFTFILALLKESMFAICLPLLRRKVSSGTGATDMDKSPLMPRGCARDHLQICDLG
jgi:hypothetical protein